MIVSTDMAAWARTYLTVVDQALAEADPKRSE
jgi:hypothetical protein